MNKRPRKKNTQMMVALTAGAILNVIILLILGGVTVYKFVAPKEVELQAPPPLEAIDPPVVKYNQQKTKDREKNSARPRQKQIKARSLNNIVTPDINIQVSDATPGVSTEGIGGDMGGLGGLTGGGLRMGTSAVDFFGIKSKGERIVIIVDVAASMLEVQRGDIEGFSRVKDRVVEVIEGLNSATLFNVMVFSNSLDVMGSDLVLANAENKGRAASFMKPYWEAEGSRFTPSARRGTFLNNYTPEYPGLKPLRGPSRTDMALLAAFEQKADAIFMITDGTPDIVRERNREERKVYEARLAEYEKAFAKATDKDKAEYERELQKWREDRARGGTREEVARRNEQGKDAQVRERYRQRPLPPWGMRPPNSNIIMGGDKEFITWMKDRAVDIYGKGRGKLPSLNLIGYSIPKRGETSDFLNDLRRAFPGGQFKIFGKYLGDDEAS
ncbi:MAG: hypothetical protein ACPGN3_18280 [Opitutales bacterium]